jgi:hypothetical protein
MNSQDITIEEVNLRIDNASSIEGKLHVTISLKNHARTTTYYVLKRPRNYDYDKAGNTLSIDLYEKAQPGEAKAGSRPFEPELLAIPPDSTLQWQYSLPIWIKKITRPPGAREMVDVMDISKAQRVVCTVAYHLDPSSAPLATVAFDSAARM